VNMSMEVEELTALTFWHGVYGRGGNKQWNSLTQNEFETTYLSVSPYMLMFRLKTSYLHLTRKLWIIYITFQSNILYLMMLVCNFILHCSTINISVQFFGFRACLFPIELLVWQQEV
jgi:hypothetical protein